MWTGHGVSNNASVTMATEMTFEVLDLLVVVAPFTDVFCLGRLQGETAGPNYLSRRS